MTGPRTRRHDVTGSCRDGCGPGLAHAATVAADADPGYGATAVMFGEAALSLAQDDLTAAGGVLTPAAALGGHLVNRLRDRGLELSVRRY